MTIGTFRSITRFRAQFRLAATLAVVLCALMVTVTTPANASQRGTIIPGSHWLQGQGVDVRGNGMPKGSFNYDDLSVQCVDLAKRLYASKGWPAVRAGGNGGAYYIPEGSPGMQHFLPGSGYVPLPGDLIIENRSSVNGNYGHVAVVDYVVGNEIHAVEQNASENGSHTYTLNGSNYGGAYAGVRLIMHAPQNTFKNPGTASNPIGDGSFIRVAGSADVYRVAGGAPLYVTDFAPFGGIPQISDISQAQFNGLGQRPADGTLIRGVRRGEIYRIVGGAPLYIANGSFPGLASAVNVDDWVIDHIGDGRSRLSPRPADGSTIRGFGRGEIYVVVGGAPVYVTSGSFPGVGSAVNVDDWAIDQAGDGRTHLSAKIVDGTIIRGWRRGEMYVIAGGAPIYITPSGLNWVTGGRNAITVDDWAIDNAGNTRAHVAPRPSDDTYLRTSDMRVWRVFGGRATYLSSWDQVGGVKPATNVDRAAIDNAGQPGVWSHLG